MKVLITGGAGYIGTALVQSLKKYEDVLQIVILDNLLSGNQPRYESAMITFVEGDIRDKQLVRRLVSKTDIVVHLAAIVGTPACDLSEDLSYQVNIVGTENVAYAAGNKPMISMSTASIYGDQEGVLVTEQTQAKPLSLYGEQKLHAEAIVEYFCPNHIIYRPVTAFGVTGRVRLDTLPNTFIYNALAQNHIEVYQPNVIRPFIHAHDFANAIAWAISGRVVWGETYNLGNKHLTMTKGDLAKFICAETGAAYEEIGGADPEMRNYDISFEKFAKNSIGTMWYDSFAYAIEQFQHYGIENIVAMEKELDTVSNTRKFIEKAKGNV